MSHGKALIWIVLLSFSWTSYGIHHRLSVRLEPESHLIEVTDTITIPGPDVQTELHFFLHRGLDVVTCSLPIESIEAKSEQVDFGLSQNTSLPDAVETKSWLVRTPEGNGEALTFEVSYRGKIHHDIIQLAQEYARGFSETPGIIDERGVYLSGASAWIPWFQSRLITFELSLSLPQGWHGVSQGARSANKVIDGRQHVTWNSPEPMEEIYLIAAPFHLYERPAGTVNTMAYLRTPDESLATKYLETTAQYLDMYNTLIGPFPFKKFALVENFWETGYGMPSFTLLGEKVIRFPFILHSSYPHELLHNYWGNSVYVDADTGNWCEGLTVFMADQLIKEQRGQGVAYRRAALQRFTDYVNANNDFPLTDFRSRFDAASEAIGYGKSQMMFNMLRSEVGPEAWIEAIRLFYRENQFKRASFSDIRRAFESVSGRDLTGFFDQWTKRTGAPEFRFSDVKTEPGKSGTDISFSIHQIQKEDPFHVTLPIAIWTNGSVHLQTVSVTQPNQNFKLTVPQPPRRLTIDPEFDVFRRLHYNEIPPSLSKVFGAERVIIILPSQVDETLRQAYQNLASAWEKDKSRDLTVVRDSELEALPADRAAWIMGRKNRFSHIIDKGLVPYSATHRENDLDLGHTTIVLDDHSVVVAVRHPANPNSVAVWLTLGNQEAWKGLTRKLPHYGKYSALAFQGTEPNNTFKHQWPVVGSPLVYDIASAVSSDDPFADLPKREPLAKMGPVFSEKRLKRHVDFLASPDLEGRGWGSSGLNHAANYIADEFSKAGLTPMGDLIDGQIGFFQNWTQTGGPEEKETILKNVVAKIPGNHPQRKDEAVVICAHYDHLGLGWPDVRQGNEGKIHFGADDNASGVAVMLELAHVMAKTIKPHRTLIFVAFTAEESGLLGSQHFVEMMTKAGSPKIMSAINLDTVGRLEDGQLMVLSGQSAREWKFIFMGCSYVTGVQSVMASQELDASDQKSFIAAGIPAVQLFSGPHQDYHRPSDKPENVDHAGLIKVATFTRAAIGYLTEREEPLTFAGQSPKKPAHGGPARSVSTGTMPDFAFSGEGVRVGSIAEGSPAEKAGLLVGDVIVAVEGTQIADLRSYSQSLKQYTIGDTVQITVLRDGAEKTFTLTFAAR